MIKRVWLVVVILGMLFSVGCDLLATTGTQETAVALSDFEIATLEALSTQVNSTPDGILRLPTPTLKPEGASESSEASITITGISEQTPGVANVTWQASGDFPSGFKVVWSDAQGYPTYPENSAVAVASSIARSAQITVTPGVIYYVRVCRFVNESCDVYSDLGIFAFSSATPNPKPVMDLRATVTAAAHRHDATASVSGTALSYDPTLKITLMKGGEDGKAYMAWTDKNPGSSGYKIVYSKTSTTPTYGTDSYFYIADSNARSAYVEGDSSTQYYYRLCRVSSSGCGSYSEVYSYKFPVANTVTPDASTITLTAITDTATGAAQVTWTASGTFSNGFKILYSKTNTLPTLSDSVTYVSDGSARLGSISGDPSGTYHVRVCKYTGSGCSVYSSVMDFTFASDPATITINGLADNSASGAIDLGWTTASGTFPNGFKILLATSATPTYENATTMVAAASGATSGTITGSANTHYYLRVCKYTGSGCGVYSNIVEFTTASDSIDLTSSTTTDFAWTLTPNTDNADGYRLFWSSGKLAPVWSSAAGYQTAVAADRSMSITPLSTGHYILRLCTWDATGSTCTAYSNTVEIDAP